MLPSKFLCDHLGFSKEQLAFYARTCPRRYKKYPIEKRNGGKRQIAQPSKNLKIIQKLLLNGYLKKHMPVHDCATAYKEHHSILDNARPHLQNDYLLKLDFSNFFPSIKSSDFKRFCLDKQIIAENVEEEINLMSSILFMREGDELVLSIGAPSSPHISNALLFNFDDKISKIAQEAGVSYTRYSDDITFSTNEKNSLFEWPKIVENELKKLSFPRLSLNYEKIVFSSKKHNRHVTGVTISNEGTPSLGHSRKREIRSMVYRLKNKDCAKKEIESLRGTLAFAKMVEPDFYQKLLEKYPDQMRFLKQ